MKPTSSDTQPCHYSTLACGLRLVMHHDPQAVAAHCGLTVKAGSRDEPEGLYGLAHFVEHTIFKGTARRRAWHILNRMERVGGELNAYTTKEETVVYTTYPAGYLERAVDLLADLVANSQFPTAEIDRERQVVEDEIDSYLDTPSEGVFDDFEELAFAGTPLAHPILGSRDSIGAMDSDTCRRWLESHYTAGNMVLFYWGPATPGRVFKIASRYFDGALKSTPAATASRPGTTWVSGQRPFEVVRNISSHQAHTVMGTRVCDMYSPRRHALALLTNVLGGPGMNSLLNVALRERRGLVYSVEANTSLMTDAGLTTVYFGCDPQDVGRCTAIVNDTIGRQLAALLTPRRLQEAKRQYEGQLTIASTNSEQRALSMGRATLLRGHVTTRSELLESIAAITRSQMFDEAHALLPMSRLTLL